MMKTKKEKLEHFAAGLAASTNETLLAASRDELTVPEFNQRLKLIQQWIEDTADSKIGKSAEAIARLAIAHAEIVPNHKRIVGLLKRVSKTFLSTDAPTGQHNEAAFFSVKKLTQFVPDHLLRTRLKRWAHHRFRILNDDQLQVFAESLPRKLNWFPDWQFEFFWLAFQRRLDPVKLGVLPEVRPENAGKRRSYIALWITLWFAGLYERLAHDAELVADKTGDPEDRFFQVRGLAMSGQFERAKQAILHSDMLKTGELQRKKFANTLISNGVFATQNNLSERLKFFLLLNHLPLQDTTTIQMKYRGTCRLLMRETLTDPAADSAHDHEREQESELTTRRATVFKQISSMPERLSFDPGWPIYRLSILHRAGFIDSPASIREAIKSLPENPEQPYSVEDILVICRLLSVSGNRPLLEKWAEVGSQLCSHPRLLQFHTEHLLEEGDAGECIAAALRLLLITMLAKEAESKPLRLFQESIQLVRNAGDENAAQVALQRVREVSLKNAPQPLGVKTQLYLAKEAIKLATGLRQSEMSDDAVRRIHSMLSDDRLESLGAISELLLPIFEGDHEKAKTILRNAIASEMDDAAQEILVGNLQSIFSDEDLFQLLQGIEDEPLPIAWLQRLASFYQMNGNLTQSLKLAEQILKTAPDNKEALHLKIRLLTSLDRNDSALEACSQVMERDPRNLPALRLQVAVMRAKKVTTAKIRDHIEKSIEPWQAVARRREIRVNLLQVASLPQHAFVESWQWYRDELESHGSTPAKAVYQLCKALKTMGELGVAEYFVRCYLAIKVHDKFIGESLREFEQLRELLDLHALDWPSVRDRCEALVKSIQSGARFLPLNNQADSRKLVRVPECLFDFMWHRLGPHGPGNESKAGNTQSFNGPACVVTSSLGPGGAERQVVYTASGLKQEVGDEGIVVLCGNLGEHRNTSFFLPRLREAGVQVFTADMANPDVMSHNIKQTEPDWNQKWALSVLDSWPQNIGKRYLVAYYRFFVEHQPRVVHAWQDETSVLAGIGALLAGVPRIIMAGRSLSPTHRPTKPTYLKAGYEFLTRFDRVQLTNNSAAGADDYAEWLNYPAEKISVIHNGFDFSEVDERLSTRSPADVRASLDIPEDAVLIGAVQRMNEVKRPDLCLDIMLELLDLVPNSYAMIVGGGSMFQEISQRGADSRHAARLRFPGAIHPVEPWMAAMDIMLLTSRVEGLPNVLVEAQSVGTPVASTDVGGASETFVEGVSGILLKSADPKLCAGKIAEYIRRPDWLSDAARFGREKVHEEFSMSRMIGKTREILRI